MSVTTINTPVFSVFAHVIAIVMGVSVFYLAAFEPDFYLHSFVAKDHDEEAGISEHVVWSIQIPGIFLAFLASVKYSRLLPKNAKVWLLMWALACIYFAGEEASWGQWYFHWDTPESFRQLNDQQETNLHNVSSWFDQKPRFVVESWIFLAGFVWPLLRKFGIVKEHVQLLSMFAAQAGLARTVAGGRHLRLDFRLAQRAVPYRHLVNGAFEVI